MCNIFTQTNSKHKKKMCRRCRCESSVQALVFCRTWDGVKHDALSGSPLDHEKHRAGLLYILMHIRDNKGRPPKEFVQEIDD